ncbi:MAG: CehA/McbA family metallohydrolase [Ignisphaera sp.]|nr:CehA/McbA family metallohydrolase [Ignisphaera sp.]MCX8167715.1 CehA/McbA family metallohydrolase [Ignisphaera sp.]MDW8085279.1 CehA/McbA family metallohydrolase [Ignisphaera sp.]
MNDRIFEYILEDRIPGYIKQSNDFIEIPFKIDSEIDVLLIEFIISEDMCRLGIGVIDPAGALRGWSAERRSKIYIARATATPGYIPGNIHPGIWRIIARLDSVTGDGCRYVLRVAGFRTLLGSMKFDDVSRVLSYLTKNVNLVEFVRNLSELISIMNYTYPCRDYLNESSKAGCSGGSLTWYRGDLHVHSIHSDGRNTVCEIIALARSRNLDFIALTDHNTVSQNYELPIHRYNEPIIIPGMEVTTFYGHVNALNIKRYIDFRRRSKDDFRRLFDEIHEDGGLVSVNHPDLYKEPLCRDCPFRYRDVEGFDAIEVWNGPWHILNSESLLWWHTILTKGYRITAVGGSDYHGVDLTRLGEPTTWVYTNRSTIEDILHGIKMGRVYITYAPEGPLVNVKAITDSGIYTIGESIRIANSSSVELIVDVKKAKGSTLRIITPQDVYRVVEISEEGFRYREKIDAKGYSFVRVEIGRYSDPYKLIPSNHDDLLALTNPLYIDSIDTA